MRVFIYFSFYFSLLFFFFFTWRLYSTFSIDDWSNGRLNNTLSLCSIGSCSLPSVISNIYKWFSSNIWFSKHSIHIKFIDCVRRNCTIRFRTRAEWIQFIQNMKSSQNNTQLNRMTIKIKIRENQTKLNDKKKTKPNLKKEKCYTSNQ